MVTSCIYLITRKYLILERKKMFCIDIQFLNFLCFLVFQREKTVPQLYSGQKMEKIVHGLLACTYSS